MSFFKKNHILKYFYSGTSAYESSEEMRKVYLINIFNFIAFLFVFPLGINALYHGAYLLSFALLFISVILTINYFFLKFSHNKEIASLVIPILFFILFCYLVYSGGVNNTGPLWIYTLPMIMMSLMGFRKGIVAMLLFFAIIILILFVLHPHLYPYSFKLRLVLSLLLVTFLTSVYEYLRESAFDRMHILSKQLEEASHQDHLTQVYNRRGIHHELENACAQYKTENKNFSLLICDIDYFKKINDNYGHIVGDEVLKKVASEIQKRIRKNDVLARWGGEEFLILLPDTNIDRAYEIAENIRQSIENSSFVYDAYTITMTVSIGIAEKKKEKTLFHTINQADKHMYIAKEEGRNTVYPRPI